VLVTHTYYEGHHIVFVEWCCGLWEYLVSKRCVLRRQEDSCRLLTNQGRRAAVISLPCSFIHFHSSMALQPFVGPWPLLQFRNLSYTVGRTPWTSDQPVARPLPTQRRTQTQNKRTHKTSIPWMKFEPTIPAFERAKTVHALDRAATMIFTTVLTHVNSSQLSSFHSGQGLKLDELRKRI
jgi:hypothetical protein